MEDRSRTILLNAALLCGLLHLSTCLPSTQVDLQSPHSVRVEANAVHSLTLSWIPPAVTKDGPQLTGYSIMYLSSTGSEEEEISVEREKQSVMLTHLQPASNYTVQVVAHYSNNQSASSLKFVVSTLTPTYISHQECDCHVSGMASCTVSHESGESKCTCHPGYIDKRCETCASDYFNEGEKCIPCNCSTAMSTGSCTPNVKEQLGRECSCLPGHFGPSCNVCETGFFWYEDRCLSCECLHLCPVNKGHDFCHNCELALDRTAVAIQRCLDVNNNIHHKKQVSHNDGTVAVVAVVVSLAFIASVAGGVSYYRYKCQKQAQHSSLWSMELHEEKVSLNSACDYQRLDAAAINAKQDSKKQKNKLQQHNNKSEGNHKYHCISI